jgi:hypothetical protein
LVEQGADFNAVDSGGRTALDAAPALKMESVVKFLPDRVPTPESKKTAELRPSARRLT